MSNKKYLFIIAAFLLFKSVLFAAETRDKIGVFIFSSTALAKSGKEFARSLEKNGLDASAIRIYLEREKFGFDDFSKAVIESSSSLNKVMILFTFHGADAGGCNACQPLDNCFQGNLCDLKRKYISAQQIGNDFLLPLAGKEIVIFFKSCFSGHLAKKLHDLAMLMAWERPTPIALVATDSNTITNRIGFVFPNYMPNQTLFSHWENLEQAQRYEKMANFQDFVHFVNAEETEFTFSFFSINNGTSIQLVDFGFKNPLLQPNVELQELKNIYEEIEKKIAKVDLSKLIVLIIETRRNYKDINKCDPWLNSFLEKGVPKEKIHWLRAEKIGDEIINSQVHLLQDCFDFISPEHNILILVRGDEPNAQKISSPPWNLKLDSHNILSAETIIKNIFPKLKNAERALLLMVSTHADIGLSQLVEMSGNQLPDNMGLVSFYSSDRANNYSSFGSWPWGCLAPTYYTGEHRFYCNVQGLGSSTVEKRSRALRALKAFGNIINFEHYLIFLTEAASIMFEDIYIKTHNARSEDLSSFGFLPRKIPLWWRDRN